MQSVESAHILAIRTCLSAEALCVCGHLYRKILLVKDAVSVKVCYWHLCGRNHIEVIQGYVIHLALFVGKLTCTIGRGLINHQWRLVLCIASSYVALQEV